MEKVLAVVIDDEEKSREVLKAILNNYAPNVSVIGEASSIKAGIDVINQKSPDLVFLDIRFKKGLGFEVLEAVDCSKLNVIFVTAYDQYAIRAIKLSASDYLLKPINESELVEAIKKIEADHNRNLDLRISVLEEMVKKPNIQIDRLVLNSSKGFDVVLISEILYIEGEKNYSIFKLEDGKEIVVSKPLVYYERLLDGTDLLRVYKSFIINIGKVREYHFGRVGNVILSSGGKIPISRDKKHVFLTALKSITKG